MFKDPIQFAQILLGQDLWRIQQRILDAVARYPRTAVKACHASGKTFIAAAAVLWWITSQLEAIAITSAPTWAQVEEVLWREIRHTVGGARIRYPQPAATALHLGPSRYAGRYEHYRSNKANQLRWAPDHDTSGWMATGERDCLHGPGGGDSVAGTG